MDSPQVKDGTGGASVAFPVQLGAHWDLDLVGAKRSKALELAALPFVRGGETFSSASLEFVTAQVRTFLQDEGRLLAKVAGTVGQDANGKVLHLVVQAGPLTPIVAVLFPGAHTVPVKLLRERVGARPGHFWRWGGEPVDEETLAADASSLLGTLRDAGLADATVGEPRIVPVRGGVDVEFPIEEGSRRTVAALEIAGVPAAVKTPKLPLAKGGPWSQRAEDEARERPRSRDPGRRLRRRRRHRLARVQRGELRGQAARRAGRALGDQPRRGRWAGADEPPGGGPGRRDPGGDGRRAAGPARGAAPVARARHLRAGGRAPDPRTDDRGAPRAGDRRQGSAHQDGLFRPRLRHRAEDPRVGDVVGAQPLRHRPRSRVRRHLLESREALPAHLPGAGAARPAGDPDLDFGVPHPGALHQLRRVPARDVGRARRPLQAAVPGAGAVRLPDRGPDGGPPTS